MVDFSAIGPYRTNIFMGSRPLSYCFADEVVIDFPSVAPAVDRIRKAFLADEPSSALSTEVQLSRRQARHGTRVSLDVPVPCTCHACGGRGEMWKEPCARLQGGGTEVLRLPLPLALAVGGGDV